MGDVLFSEVDIENYHVGHIENLLLSNKCLFLVLSVLYSLFQGESCAQMLTDLTEEETKLRLQPQPGINSVLEHVWLLGLSLSEVNGPVVLVQQLLYKMYNFK